MDINDSTGHMEAFYPHDPAVFSLYYVANSLLSGNDVFIT